MNVYEWVLVQVWELVGPIKSLNREKMMEIEGLRMENKVLLEKIRGKGISIENLERIVEENKKNYERIKIDDKKFLMGVQNENKKLHMEVIEMRHRSEGLIALEKENFRLADENEAVQNKLRLFASYDDPNTGNLHTRLVIFPKFLIGNRSFWTKRRNTLKMTT